MQSCSAASCGTAQHEPWEAPFSTKRNASTFVQYIQDTATARPTPRDLAVELHLSADYFSRAFRRTFSVSPRRWLLNERIRLAAMLLAKPGLSVSEVAYQFGYRDVYLFSRQFKQVFGLSPRFFQRHSGL